MKNTVFIIKSSSWKNINTSRNHPEVGAILDIIAHYGSEFRFVLVGSSSTPTAKVQMKNGPLAWDVQKTGRLGEITYLLELMRLLLCYRPQIVAVLGLLNVLPVATYSLLSKKAKYIPVFVEGFSYHGRKISGRFLFCLGLKALGVSLKLSRSKMLSIFTLSKYGIEGITKLAPSLEGKIKLVSYPIHPEFCCGKRASPSELTDGPLLLTVAKIEPRKGLDTLIKAVSLLPRKPRLIVKGGVGDIDYMHKLAQMVDELDLKDRVTFVTDEIDYDKLVSYYKSATLFVLPTREDCLGVVILEALHCGIPVIATSVGGIPDMIEDGVNGKLVPPDKPVELASAISSILGDRALREKLALNARRTLFRKYYSGRITLKEALIQSIENT